MSMPSASEMGDMDMGDMDMGDMDMGDMDMGDMDIGRRRNWFRLATQGVGHDQPARIGHL